MRMLRPAVDMAMTLLLLLSMAYEMVGPAFEILCEKLFGVSFDGYETGGIIHEWLGTALILLFFWHLWLNRYWLKNLFKGRYNATRTVLALANLLLIIDVGFLLVSGVMMSKILDLPIEGGMDFARTSHMLASYWGYIIMSFHIGLYWHVMSGMMFRRPSLASGVLPHAAAVGLMAYGAYAFVKRQLGEYMFLTSQFVFFDFEEPIAYFFLDYIAIMILFACLGHYLILLFRGLKI
ncbi:MAG: DUF4405 domain-containing protein [Synergistaceae bacterium]|nr:DUF4405 domain-containing protein [Synergistaceae bacterium]